MPVAQKKTKKITFPVDCISNIVGISSTAQAGLEIIIATVKVANKRVAEAVTITFGKNARENLSEQLNMNSLSKLSSLFKHNGCEILLGIEKWGEEQTQKIKLPIEFSREIAAIRPTDRGGMKIILSEGHVGRQYVEEGIVLEFGRNARQILIDQVEGIEDFSSLQSKLKNKGCEILLGTKTW